MRKTYKLFATIVALVIILSALFAFPASAANVNYSVTSASGEKGSTVTVTVKASSTVGLTGTLLDLKYDSSKLQYVSSSNGNVYDYNTVTPGSSYVRFLGARTNGDANAKKNGTLFTVTFKILMSSGTASLTVSPSSLAGDHVGVGGNVAPVVSNGSVKATIPVSGVSLDKTSVSLKKGETSQIKATVKPDNADNKTVTYTSSNTKVATVNSSGKITAVGGGTATVTAKAGGKTASCKVTVTVPQTGIKVSGNASRTVGEGSTARLSVVKVPADATDSYNVTWTSADTKIATVSSNGTVTGVALGTTEITARSNNWTAVFKITVVAKSEETTTEAVTEDTNTTLPEDTSAPTEELSTELITEITTEEIITENNDNAVKKTSTVTKLYHYAMLIGVALVTSAASVSVTFFVTANYYQNKYRKKDNER